MRFSQRIGIVSAENVLQIEFINDDLKNSLWSLITACYWERFNKSKWNMGSRGDYIRGSNLEGLVKSFWFQYFKKPIDTIPMLFYDNGNVLDVFRNYYYSSEWYEIYDFVEFLANNGPTEFKESFINACNNTLEVENSGYRFVDSQIIEIGSKEEVSEIEDALNSSDRFFGVKQHLSTAIGLLSDRQNPDFRNSIKESISAVESLCKIVSGDRKATLGIALKKLEERGTIHPALKSAFSSLYGYTNDADGIRHALLEEENLTSSEARFMLITCSAFVNYVLASQ